jgi:hypothetical protein
VVALLALVLVAVSAGAEPRQPENGRHLLSVPADGPAANALARSDVRVIARYDAFTVVEAAGDDAERLQRAGADLRNDMREVKVGRAEIDPARDRAPLRGLSRGRPALAVVQFVGPVKDAWLARLRATGARVVTYMAENGYLVRASAAELAVLDELSESDPAVRAVVEFTPADKLLAGTGQEGRRRFAVQTLSGADGARARERVEDQGRRLWATSAVGPFRTQYVELDSAEAAALAEDPGVVAVQAAPEPELLDERADQIVAGALNGPDPLVPSGPGYLAFYDDLGLGTEPFPFTVDVTDEGFDTGSTATDHADFHEGGVLAAPSRITYADDFTSDPDARDCGGHGTINASIIGGFNNGTGAAVEDAQGFNYGLGVAPRVPVGSTKIFRCDDLFGLAGATLTDIAANSYAKGARIGNHSWGAPVGGAYTADSQEFDEIVRDAQPLVAGNQEMVEVFAAGNSGAGGVANTVGSPATAKNVIAVGATESVRTGTGTCSPDTGADDAHDMAGFSSRGPTDDGRTKPELVGPGTNVTGSQSHASGYNGDGVCTTAFPAASTLYTISTGTSHSSPVVAGMAALFREWFRQRKGGNTVTPSPALTRAALTNSATDVVGGVGVGGNFPNSNQGWGLGNIPRLLDGGPRVLLDQETTFGASGDSFSRTLTVQDSSKPVRVTLAWTDAPGPLVGTSYVNNLDLAVTAGTGTYKGNVFSGGVSITGGTADAANNLEGVYLPGGASGDITVTVTAANIVGDGVPGPPGSDLTDQDFALVITNAGTAPAQQPTGLTATPGAGSVSLDWSDVPSASGYEVFRRDAGGVYPSTPAAWPASSDYVDSGRTPGTSYCYVVRAMSHGTPGPLSGEACATVPAAATPGGADPGGGDPGGGDPGGGDPGGGDPGGGTAPTVSLASLASSVTVGARGIFSLTFAGTPGAAGTIKVTTVKAVSAARRRKLVVARRSFTAPASGRVRVKLKLTRKGFRVLRRLKRLPVSAKVTLGQTSAKKRVTLRAPRPRPRS